MRRTAVAAFVLLTLALSGQNDGLRQQPLHSGWRFRQLPSGPWHDAEVPGTVHTDLLRHGLIPDPFFGDNASELRWIEEADWEYELRFTPAEGSRSKHAVQLVFEGLDTFAEVWLNGDSLGRADNMFRSWRWGVREKLVEGENTLRVVFRSPVREGARVRERYGLQLPHDNDPGGTSPYVRKAAYQFGWDFAPRLVTSGIWRPVRLEAWDHPRIGPVGIEQQWHGDRLTVAVSPVFLPHPGRVRGGRLVLRLNGRRVASERFEPPKRRPRLSFTLDRPARWWPRGEGDQELQELSVELVRKKEVLSRKLVRTGWRSVELDQQPDSIGTAFTFRVNGRPVFMKGCNIVPPDMFLPRAADGAWVALVERMAEAGMNMARVWAGGVYPPDAFYEACDAAGIMVWHDFMFATPLPAGDAAFRENAHAEVVEQLERTAHHPCMALWCGNNELDVAWRHWGWQQRYDLHGGDSARVWNDQRGFFEGMAIARSVERIQGIPYVHTSPLSNWGSAEGLRHGSLHYWGVWHGDSTLASFGRNVGRFVTEWGFQSWPDSTTLARYMSPQELYHGSPALARRQRSYKGDLPIRRAIEEEFGTMPTGLAAYLEASRQVQALACERAFRAHRSAQPHCMGSLVWQLNTPWPGPSWSLLDHDGTPKPAFEAVKRALSD